MSNSIPEGWENALIGNYVSIQGGCAFKSEDFHEFGVPIIRISNIKRNGSIDLTESVFTKFKPVLSRYEIVNGDVLIAMSGATTGKVGRYHSSNLAYMNQRVGRFKVRDTSKVKLDFIHQVTSTDQFISAVLVDAAGGAQPNISNQQIESFNVLLPPLPEQQKIASILSSVDTVIETTRAQIDKLKDLKTSMMQELLTKGIGHTEFKDSPVGRIPKGWSIDKLINLSINGINNGVFNDPKNVGSGYRLINVVNMYRGFGIQLDTLKRLEIDEKEFARNKVEKGDVFFTRSSLKLEGIAYCNINLSDDDDITYDGHLMRVRPDQSRVLPKYLAYYCLSDFARVFFMQGAKHSTMTTIGQADIAPLPVLVPSMEEQIKICKVLDSIASKISTTEAKLISNQQVKKALMQDLLTGKVRVKVEATETA